MILPHVRSLSPVMILENLAEHEVLTEVPQRLALAHLSEDTMGNTSQL